MNSDAVREHLQQYTLERYETEFADRHLLHGAIAKWAAETPDALALIEADTGKEYTYRQFDQITTALALKLLEAGFEKGDFLATSLPLLAEHIFLEYACFKIGVIHAPLDLRLKAPEVIRSIGIIEAKGYTCLGRTPVADFSELGRVVKEACQCLDHFIQFAPPDETIEGAVSAAQFFAEAQELAQRVQTDEGAALWQRYEQAAASIKPTDGCQVIYTTGSTGLPKPALLSHRNITCQNMCLAAGFGMQPGMRMLVNLPPSHVGCQGEQLMTTLFLGSTCVVLHVFDAAKSLKAIQDYRVDTFGQIPAMFNMQWRLPNYDDYDVSSVQKVMFGGQAVTRQFIEQLLNRFPTAGQGLGLSEMAGFVTYSGMTDNVDDLVGNVGWWAPVTPLTIRGPMNADGSAGPELPDGETGEICFSGPQVFIDYVNNPEAYRKTVSTEGVCYTGDLGYKSDRGLIFSGRAKLVIKPKGYQIHPSEIENHFAKLADKVAVCGAVGAPHDIFTEGVVLFIEPKPSAELDRAELDAHAKGIAGYMRPSHYVVLEPGGLPLNRVAKTDYVRLAELALAEVKQLRERGGWDQE